MQLWPEIAGPLFFELRCPCYQQPLPSMVVQEVVAVTLALPRGGRGGQLLYALLGVRQQERFPLE